MKIIFSLYGKFNHIAAKLSPISLLLCRLVIANVFFAAGMQKLDDWEGTLLLFEAEYMVPILPHQFAAISATIFEIACSILLVLGLATKLAALPLIMMTLVIEFTYLSSPEHLYWFVILATLLATGPGKLSLDFAICKFLRKKSENQIENSEMQQAQ